MARRPLLPVALALMGGVLVQHWLEADLKWLWLCVLAVSATAAGIFILLRRDWSRRAALAAILTLLVAAGALLDLASDPRHDIRHWTLGCNAQVWMELRLQATPQPRERSYRVEAAVAAVDGQPRRGDITLYLRRDSVAAGLRYGEDRKSVV